jgi:hypothetical protein
MKKELCNHVYKTNDYKAFKFIAGNRVPNRDHLRRLTESMEQKQLVVPIIVNEHMQIVDGQTRYLACKSLKKPVYFIVNAGYRLPEVHRLNTTLKAWTANDFMMGYISLGKTEYKIYRAFKEKHGLGHQETLTLLMGRRGYTWGTFKNFRDGNLKIRHMKEAEEALKKISMIEPYYPGYKRRSFIYAMIALFKIPEYKHEELIEKLKLQEERLFDCATTTQYRDLLHKIYNYKRREGSKINLRAL